MGNSPEQKPEPGQGAPSPQPFAGVRVVDASANLAGAYASKLLLDSGAQVLMLEAPAGHPLRRYTESGHQLKPDQTGALFQFLCAGKQSIRSDESNVQSALNNCAAACEIIIASQALNHNKLLQQNPAVSQLTITPWGSTGPYAKRPATEFTLQAAAGATAYRGLPQRGPVAAGGQIGEWTAGAYAAAAALAALLSARQTGRGVAVDVSIFETSVAALTVYHDLMGQWNQGPLPQTLDTPSVEPTRDGWVGLCTTTGQQWKDFCLLIERPELGEDQRFYDAQARMQHLPLIQSAIHNWTRKHTTAEVVELASALRIPAAPVGTGKTVLAEQHFQQRGVFVQNPGGFMQPRRPWQLSALPAAPIQKAPALPAAAADDANTGAGAQLLQQWRAQQSTFTAAAQQTQTAAAETPPLAGLRVMDLTAFWAGPVMTSVLAEWGADVIKIESIQRPDGMRFAGAIRNEIMWEWSPVFHGANTGKRAITLNLDSTAGRKLMRRLIQSADVLCENFSARVMQHFNLTWETLHQWNPRLIMLRMPAWGLSGPWRDRTGFAANVEQASGLAWITGYKNMPLAVRGACDPVGGMHALIGLLSALEMRRTSGRGQLVECALVEPALNIAAAQSVEYSAYGALITRNENRGPRAAPQGCYRCQGAPASARDDAHRYEPWLALACETTAHWHGLRRALGGGFSTWAAAPEFLTTEGRRKAHDQIDEHINNWCAQRSAYAAAEELQACGVPAAALVNAHWLMPHPQLQARGFYCDLQHPAAGKVRYPGFPARFSGWNAHARRTPAPTLGQHNEEILRGELGLGAEELEQLRAEKVIGTRPAWM